MAKSLKGKASCSRSWEGPSLKRMSPDLLHDVKSFQRKRRRISTARNINDSSTDSFPRSNSVPSYSEGSSDSEFEEHSYSRSTQQLSKSFGNSRPRRKLTSGTSVAISQFEIDGEDNKRSKCTNKNALMARLNRLKKKKYIEDLENKNALLEAENQMLKNMLDIRVKEVESLKKKALNLENVIRNSTEIGSLLKCVRQHTDLEISSSLIKSVSNNSPASTEVNTPVLSEKPNSSDFNDFDVSPTEEEALVAAVLWGMALHTFCQPYKRRTSDFLSLQEQKYKSDTC